MMSCFNYSARSACEGVEAGVVRCLGSEKLLKPLQTWAFAHDDQKVTR